MAFRMGYSFSVDFLPMALKLEADNLVQTDLDKSVSWEDQSAMLLNVAKIQHWHFDSNHSPGLPFLKSTGFPVPLLFTHFIKEIRIFVIIILCFCKRYL